MNSISALRTVNEERCSTAELFYCPSFRGKASLVKKNRLEELMQFNFCCKICLE